MHAFFIENLEPILAVLILIARAGDIGTTFLATPKMTLEANPLMRRFRWPFALLTLLLFLSPYWSIEAGIVILIVSLLVSTTNSVRLWFVRAIGESEYQQLLVKVSHRANFTNSIMLTLLPGFFMSLLGGTLMVFYPDENAGMAFYFALGIVSYGFTLLVNVPSNFLRLRKLPEQKPVGLP